MEVQQGFLFKPEPMTLMALQVDCGDSPIRSDAEPHAMQGIGDLGRLPKTPDS